MESIDVTRVAIERLLREAEAASPEEACGLLLGRRGRIERAVPALNVHPEPLRHFEIDPQTLIDAHRAARAGGPEILGYYHSHPTGLAEPSAADREERARDGRVWAIVGRRDVAFWRDGQDGFAKLPYTVDGG